MAETGYFGGDLVRAEENVVIQAGACSVTLMPALGGKIGSLRVGANELLQGPLKPLQPRTRSMAFSDADASGWDECLPSVAACQIQTEAGQANIPDHGDLWQLPWQVLHASPDSATMRVTCFSLPLQLTRSVILTETSPGWRLQLLYSLVNLGAYRVPWSWCAHPLFAVDPGDRIVLPSSIQKVQIEGSGNHRLGRNGDVIPWPLAPTHTSSQADLSLALSADTAVGDKLFAGPFDSGPFDSRPFDSRPFDSEPASSRSGAWASLERAAIGLRLTVKFEPSLTPYLGLWLCYGGWPDAPGAKQMCVALEPATAPTDSLAETGPWSRTLEPGESFTWPMELQIEPIKTGSPLETGSDSRRKTA